MSDHFLTIDEAAEALRIHRTQLYKLVQAGEMPKPVKLGRSSRARIPPLIKNSARPYKQPDGALESSK